MRKYIRQISGHRELINRGRYFKSAALGTLGFCTRWAVDVHGHRPEWIEVAEIDLSLQNIPHRLRGVRMAHISDLHYSRTVTGGYLRRCIERINQLDVGLVVLTGDYITYDFQGKFRQKLFALLSNIHSRYGVYACLGNHDYGIRYLPRSRQDYLLRLLIQGMKDSGVTVLRNKSILLDINGHPVWLVGLGDLRSGDFRPRKAFANVPSNQITIVLMHNPRGAEYLSEYPANVVVSGHTHGAKSRYPAMRTSTSRHRRFHSGIYELDGKKLYVNRGLGRVGRIRLNSRPEITVFNLC